MMYVFADIIKAWSVSVTLPVVYSFFTTFLDFELIFSYFLIYLKDKEI